MSAVVYHVNKETNIHVDAHADADYVILTPIIKGDPLASILYTVEELQTFLHHITEKMGKIR